MFSSTKVCFFIPRPKYNYNHETATRIQIPVKARWPSGCVKWDALLAHVVSFSIVRWHFRMRIMKPGANIFLARRCLPGCLIGKNNRKCNGLKIHHHSHFSCRSKTLDRLTKISSRRGQHDTFRCPQGVKPDRENSRNFLPQSGWMHYHYSRLITGIMKNVTVGQSCGKWYISIQSEYEVFEPVPLQHQWSDWMLTWQNSQCCQMARFLVCKQTS